MNQPAFIAKIAVSPERKGRGIIISIFHEGKFTMIFTYIITPIDGAPRLEHPGFFENKFNCFMTAILKVCMVFNN